VSNASGTIIDQLPVREGTDGQVWPSLAEALVSSQADVLHGPTERPVAYRVGGNWHVDEAAVLREQADAWNDALGGAGTQLLVLRVLHAAGPIPLVDVHAAAAGLDLAGLPAVADLDQGRVWPGGSEWIAETGAAPNLRAVGEGMYPTWAAAVQAAAAALEQARDAFAARLQTEPGPAAALAGTRSRWAAPTLQIWAATEQATAWELRL
jgi:hypothetical protein